MVTLQPAAVDSPTSVPLVLAGLWLPERAQQVLVVLLELAALSSEEDSASAADVAHATGVPLRRVDVLLGDLRRQGLVMSRPGRGGGYRLARSAQSITVGQVLATVEWPITATGANRHQRALSRLQHRLSAAVSDLSLDQLLR